MPELENGPDPKATLIGHASLFPGLCKTALSTGLNAGWFGSKISPQTASFDDIPEEKIRGSSAVSDQIEPR